MKKEKRLEYLILNNLDDDISTSMVVCVCLCTWCKYCEWEGGSCEESYPDCNHPVWKVREKEENDCPTWQGADCWGFRPAYRREDVVGIVGLWLQGKYVDFNSFPKIGA